MPNIKKISPSVIEISLERTNVDVSSLGVVPMHVASGQIEIIEMAYVGASQFIITATLNALLYYFYYGLHIIHVHCYVRVYVLTLLSTFGHPLYTSIIPLSFYTNNTY